MTDLQSDRVRRLFQYEKESHEKVLAALQAVPVERRASADFQAAVDLLAHVVAARRMWLARIGQAAAANGGLEPQATQLADLPARLAEMHALWTRYLASSSDADVQRTFEYQSLDAGRFRNTVDEVLTQLYGHSLYHLGQIAARIKALGCQPPATDFILWARVAVS